MTKQHFQDIMPSLSPAILSIIAPFAVLFSKPVWNNALTLFIGAILCRGKRTVCAVLRMMGLSNGVNFSKYHHVLNRTNWSLLSAARILLNLLVNMTGIRNPLVFSLMKLLNEGKVLKLRRKAITAMPFLMGLYTIVCLICNRRQEERPIEVAQTTWYEKKDATFSDLLKTVRKILWKDNLISRNYIFESFCENNKGLDEVIGAGDRNSPKNSWVRVLIDYLTAA